MMIKVLIIGLFIVLRSFSVENTSYRLYDIQFEINSSKLTDDQIKALEGVIRTIREIWKESPEKKFTLWINGNADASEEDAKRLSNDRAEIVRKQLTNLGLTDVTFITKGFGANKPLTNSTNDTAKRRNARVDFKITLE